MEWKKGFCPREFASVVIRNARLQIQPTNLKDKMRTVGHSCSGSQRVQTCTGALRAPLWPSLSWGNKPVNTV